MRTMIAAIMPPGKFITDSVFAAVLRDRDGVIFGKEYYQKILYLAAVFNSFTFDYMIRFQVNMTASCFIVRNAAIPSDTQNRRAMKIIELAAVLSFTNEEFNKSIREHGFKARALDVKKRIAVMAELDALVAHQYGLTCIQYEYILSTFNFKNYLINSGLDRKLDAAQLHVLQGMVKKQALSYFKQHETKKLCRLQKSFPGLREERPLGAPSLGGVV